MELKGRSTPGHLQQHLTSDHQSYSMTVSGKPNGHIKDKLCQNSSHEKAN